MNPCLIYYGLIAVSVTLGLYGAYILVRNPLVYRMRTRKLREIDERIQAQLQAGTLTVEGVQAAYQEYDRAGTYQQMMRNLKAWTYRQFYPESSK